VTAVATLPVLIALLMGGSLAGAFGGPVNIWNSPSVPPADTDMVGSLSLEQLSADLIAKLSSEHVEQSRITLRPDHTVELQNVYEYVDPFNADVQPPLCQISGTGSWNTRNSGGVVLVLHLDPTAAIVGPKSCSATVWTDYAILGRSGPRSIWSYIGDPDGGMGLKYSR
jgi:hypothetical protein